MSAGRFVWRELLCATPASAFYQELFGWVPSERSLGGMAYLMFTLPGREDEVAGAMAPQMADVPNHWFGYLTVEDLDAAERDVVRLGGTVLTPQMSAPGIGRWFVATDPAGVAFAPFVGETPGATPESPPPPGTFCWSQRMAKDLGAVVPFYAGLCGYTTEQMGPATVFVKDGVQRATAMAFPPDMQMDDQWLHYVAVPDVDARTQRAVSLGGAVLVPPTDMGEMGRFSVLADPMGAVFALWTQKR